MWFRVDVSVYGLRMVVMKDTEKAVTEAFADFKSEMAKNIKTTIGKLRKDGTVAMSERNLLQVTPTPRNSRGPIGMNVQWVYAQMFSEVISGLPNNYSKFVYKA